MSDTPAYHDLPYMVGTTADGGSFAYFPSGTIRRIGNVEKQRLRDELGVRAVSISGGDVTYAEVVSETLFGI